MSIPKSGDGQSVWLNGYVFALLLLLILGITLIAFGTSEFQQGSLLNVLFVGAGIAMGPAAIVAALFRAFLFREVQYQLTQPVIEEVKERLGPEIRHQMQDIVNEYREEIATLRSLKDAGVIRPHRKRSIALRKFATAIDSESSDLMIVGSSLKGLLQMDQYNEIAEKLRFKIAKGGVRVRFLLTHPVVADLRALQEARQFGEIGLEIVKSLRTLKEWNVPVDDVRLYKGTPTCFAIRTGRQMLLNPYPYGSVSYDSPCLIVETSEEHPSYFYEAFDNSHFGAWDTNVTDRIHSYDQAIDELEAHLKDYAKVVENMLE